MKKALRRTFLLIAIVLVGFSASCKKKDKDKDKDKDVPGTSYTISYVLNGGVNAADAKTSYKEGTSFELPTPTYEGYNFEGWYADENFSGDAKYLVGEGTKGNLTFYAKWSEGSKTYTPRWELNKIGFDGKGMSVVMKVLPVEEYDPFNGNYTGDKKAIKQAHQKLVQAAYNISIEYSAWDSAAPWGPERVDFIKKSFTDGSFRNNSVYIVTLASQWIPTLASANCLAELYNMGTRNGYFTNAGYAQNDTLNAAMQVNKKVFGYSLGIARPDYFLYYNATKVNELGLKDPAELWLTGQWNASKFDEWVKQAQTNLKGEGSVIDAGYPEFAIGSVAAQGKQMVNAKAGRIMFTQNGVTSVFQKMQSYYSSGIWRQGRGSEDVSTDFTSGKSLLASGDIWFLKEPTRFDPAKVTFEIGVVPYPTADGDAITPYTQPYTYQDSQGNDVEVTEPLKTRDGHPLTDSLGQAVYGIDLTNASFQVPYGGTSCYSVMAFENGTNGINSEIVFNILNDLVGGEGDDPKAVKLTNDEAYRQILEKKLDNSIDIEVIMSCQNNTYFELMEILSMTVGNGSHFGADAFWPLAGEIVKKSSVSPAAKLDSVYDKYEQALHSIGY